MSLSVPRWSDSTSTVVHVAPKSVDFATYWLDLPPCMNAVYTVLPSTGSTTIWGSSWRRPDWRNGRGWHHVFQPSEEIWSSMKFGPHAVQAGSVPECVQNTYT